MKYDRAVRDEIIAATAERARLLIHIVTLRATLEASCDHASVVETPYYTTVFDSSVPARKICIQCGLEEDSWYRKLTAQPVRVVQNRDDFWRLRTLVPLREVAVPE